VFALAFDLVVENLKRHYPKSVSQAYGDIGRTLGKHGFTRIQGSVYVTQSTDFTGLIRAVTALKAMTWFPNCVRDIRGFRVENWSDLTGFVTTDRTEMNAANTSSKRSKHGRGFEEPAVPFEFDPPQLIGQIKRIGDYGPAYEIMSVGENGMVEIEVIESGERVALPIDQILADPIAETIP
jgi:virulence-associated protein VapD